MNLLLGAVTIGLISSLMALGVFIAYRVLDTLDLTVEGSYGLGAAVTAVMLVRGVSPFAATALGTLAGVAAGTVTGLVHTRLRVQALLAGILTTTALYSVILYVMNGGDLSLAGSRTLVTVAERLGQLLGGMGDLTLFGIEVPARNWQGLLLTLGLTVTLALGLAGFFRTNLGLAMRATVSNPRMARAVGIDVGSTLVFGLALSNGLVAMAGAIFAQFVGFANIQMGVGIFVTGVASVMIGETVLGRRGMGRWLAAVVVGSVLFRLLVAGALRAVLDPNALKLVTALLVLGALVLPRLWAREAAGRAPRSEAPRG